jgi:hypothetical protein
MRCGGERQVAAYHGIYHRGWTAVTRHGNLPWVDVTSAGTLTPGAHQVRMEFAYDGGGLGKGGTATLYVDGKAVGEGRVERTHAVPVRVGAAMTRGTSPGLSDLFADGVTFAPALNLSAKYLGKTAKHTFGGAITTKAYTPFDWATLICRSGDESGHDVLRRRSGRQRSHCQPPAR